MTDLRRTAENAAEDLNEVSLWWDELLTDAVPGTRRRWHQRRSDDLPPTHDCGTPWVYDEPLKAKGRNGRPDKIVRRPRCPNPACRESEAIGFSPSPARDDVLDKITEITFAVIDLRDRVAAAFNADRRRLRVSEACRWVGSALPQLHDLELVIHCALEARRLLDLIRAGTGQVEDVIQLDAACPICGDETLLAYAARMSVTCVGEQCVCDLHDCGCQRGRKHTWQESELVWLARLVGAEGETA